MGAFVAALPLIGKVIDRIFPDATAKQEAKLKLFELQQSSDLAELEAETKLLLGQMEINKEEARSAHWWVAGWRPAVGWVCAFGLFWNFLIQPLVMWAGAFSTPAVTVPALDISQLMVLLLGMLGIGGMRSFDKRNGKDTQAIS